MLINGGSEAGTRRLAVAKSGGGWTVEERWTTNRLKPYFNEPEKWPHQQIEVSDPDYDQLFYILRRAHLLDTAYNAEDVLRVMLSEEKLSKLKIEDIMRPPVVAPPTKKVDEMFDFFQQNNARAAVVLNEFGGVDGFVTMRDVLSFIFGQTSGVIKGEELYQERDENVYEVPGDMKLNDFNNLTNFGIEDPRMTTIGGVAFRHLDRLPAEGDTALVEGTLITVLEMKEHRISKVRVARGQGVDEDSIENDFADKEDPAANLEPRSAEANDTVETPPKKDADVDREEVFVAEESPTVADDDSADTSDAPASDAGDDGKTAIQ